MDRTGLTDAQVLAALYNWSRPQGLGMLHAKGGAMTVEEAETLLTPDGAKPDDLGHSRHGRYFDYLHGRVIKVDVSENPLDFRLYDRDLGKGAGEQAILRMMDSLTKP
jgi:hypothetical protein